MIKAIIFDLNGVFLESEYLSKRIEKRFGIPVDKFFVVLKEVLNIARKPGCKDSFKLWEPRLKKLGLSISRDEFFTFWFSGEKLNEELIDYIKELKEKNIKVFILSNNFKERTEYYRKNFSEIFDNIDKAYFSWETGLVKPDKRAYQKILNDNSIEVEDCIYFDDSEKNIEITKSLGIKSYLYEGIEKAKEIIEKIRLPLTK